MNKLLQFPKLVCEKSRLVFFVVVTAAFLLVAKNVTAAITEVQELSFGTFALVDNATVSTLRIPYNGTNPVASSKLYPLTRAQPGQYQISGMPSFQALIITINNFSLQVGAAEPFNVNTFTYPALITDTNGEALLEVGATLNTTGSGTGYADATYTGTISITISF